MNNENDAPSEPKSGFYQGTMRVDDNAQSFNAINATIRRLLAMMGADTIVRVDAVNSAGDGPIGTVDVQPLVMQQTGAGYAVAHAPIYNVPYLRMQGGRTALVIDPQVGDIGAVIICGRDISTVKQTRGLAHPGTFRMHDMADAIYIGGLLNAVPQHYIKMDGGNVTCVADQAVIKAPTRIDGDLHVDGTVSLDKNVEVKGQLKVGTGATGSFTTLNGHTIVVQNGIVTAIT